MRKECLRKRRNVSGAENAVSPGDAPSRKQSAGHCDAAAAAACDELGVLYQLGEGLVRDAEGAQRLYRQACEHGEPRAFRNLGTALRVGPGRRSEVTGDAPERADEVALFAVLPARAPNARRQGG